MSVLFSRRALKRNSRFEKLSDSPGTGCTECTRSSSTNFKLCCGFLMKSLTRFGVSYLRIAGRDRRPLIGSGTTGVPGGTDAGSVHSHHGATIIQSRSGGCFIASPDVPRTGRVRRRDDRGGDERLALNDVTEDLLAGVDV